MAMNTMAEKSEDEDIAFVTLGMFIIDDIYPPPSAPDQTPQKDIIGGAGTYSAVGARLFSPPPASKSVGWIVDAGTDFPDELRTLIATWDTGVLLRDRDALTTRGWNGYGANDHRAFKYLTPKLRLTADDLPPSLLKAKSFHLICSPLRCIEMTKRILDRRRETFRPAPRRPIIIWEPVPDLCVPAELLNTFDALRWVDVISPNHEELLSLFSCPVSDDWQDWMKDVKTCTQKLLDHGVGEKRAGAVVVRCGKQGAFYARNVTKASESALLPPYHIDSSRVVDPTGGGNGFLGGLAISLVRNPSDLRTAVMHGNVAASFCIEQVGVPSLSGAVQTIRHDIAGLDEKERNLVGRERWNGDDVLQRLGQYRHQINQR